MIWIMAGFMAGFSLTLGIPVLREIGSYPRPIFGLFMAFVGVPGLIALCSADSLDFFLNEWKTTLRDGLKERIFTRKRAFTYGFISSLATIAFLVTGYYACVLFDRSEAVWKRSDQASLSVILTAFFFVALSPLVPIYLLVKRVRKGRRT